MAEDVRITTRLSGVTGVLRGFGSIASRVRTLTTIFGVFGSALGGVTFGALTKGMIDHADAMGKLSQKVGVAVEDLTGLQVAASLSGVSMQEMANSLRFFSRAMDESQQGVAEYKEQFDRLKISVADGDGTLRGSVDVMAEVADRFAEMGDGATKTSLAVQLFGRAGSSLIPLLNQGGEALRAYRKEAEDTGQVLSEATTKAAERFNDALTRLSNAIKGAALKAIAPLIPTFARWAEEMVEATKQSGALNETMAQMVVLFKIILSSLALVNFLFQASGKLIAAYARFYVDAIDVIEQRQKAWSDHQTVLFRAMNAALRGNFGEAADIIRESFSKAGQAQKESQEKLAGAWDRIKENLKDSTGELDKFIDRLKFIWQDMGTETGAMSEAMKKLLAALSESAKLATDPLAALKSELLKMQQAYISLSAGDSALREFNLLQGELGKATGAAADALRNQIRALDEYNRKIKETQAQEEEWYKLEVAIAERDEKLDEQLTAAVETRAQRMRDLAKATQEAADPMIVYSAKVRDLIELLNDEKISQDAFNKAVGEAAKVFDQAGENITQWEKDLLQATKGFASAFTNEIASMLDNNQANWTNFRDSILSLFRKAILDAFITGPLTAAINKIVEVMKKSLSSMGGSGGIGGVIGSAIGNLFSGGGYIGGLNRAQGATYRGASPYQHGGTIPAGFAGIVGEAGPELIVPAGRSRVVPNDELGGGGTIIVNQTFQTGVSRAELSTLLPRLKADTINGVLEAKRRGGQFSRSF